MKVVSDGGKSESIICFEPISKIPASKSFRKPSVISDRRDWNILADNDEKTIGHLNRLALKSVLDHLDLVLCFFQNESIFPDEINEQEAVLSCLQQLVTLGDLGLKPCFYPIFA